MRTRSSAEKAQRPPTSSPVANQEALSDVTDKVVSNKATSMRTRAASKKNAPTAVDQTNKNGPPAAGMRTRSSSIERNEPVKTKRVLFGPDEVFSITPRKRVEDDGACTKEADIINLVEEHKEDPLKIYFCSKEAEKLFRPKGGETVLEALDAQISLLMDSFIGDKWKTIVDPKADLTQEYYLVPGSIDRIKNKAMVLAVALDIARRDKPYKTWAQCCEQAVKLTYSSFPEIKPPCHQTAQSWYREFREDRYFPSKKFQLEAEKLKKKQELKAMREADEARAKKEEELVAASNEEELEKLRKEANDLLAKIEKGMAQFNLDE